MSVSLERTALRRRFAASSWPTAAFKERTAALKSMLGLAKSHSLSLLNSAAISRNYPLRLIRYWWAYNAIRQESLRFKRRLDIVDVGCGLGMTRHFVGDGIAASWVGLDGSPFAEFLRDFGYAEIHVCDFDNALPVSSQSADVVTCLHVMEHVLRPVHTMAELARILRPGGLLVIGSPVVPKVFGRIRQGVLRRQLRRGVRRLGKHIHCFWPARWLELADLAGFETEVVAGAHLLRWAGSPLENSRWWLRFNQLWGAMFPSLGGDIYLLARRRSDSGFQAALAVSDEHLRLSKLLKESVTL